jgi:hypothetical protein
MGFAIAIAFCASAFAGPNKKVELAKQQSQKNTRKVCYTYISGSSILQPCDRLGPIPTTSYPMDRVGSK